jgi:branched-chain amino acid transport system permease protein
MALSIVRRPRGGSPHHALRRDPGDELRLFGSRPARAGLAAAIVVWAGLPMVVLSDFWLSILIYAGIAAIGAIGLNLLTGYTGQVSMGHAFFIGLGAYAAGYLAARAGLPMLAWLAAAGLLGALVGAVVGPFALRLRGNYLAIVTLGLVFVGEHLFRNVKSITGGNSGSAIDAPATIGPVRFDDLAFLGQAFSRNQGWFWLVWALVALGALMAKNLVRTRPGRALQAVRDRELAAEVMGVRLGRYKMAAFAVSSAFGAVAGALYGSYQQFASPDEWTLFLSIQYIAIIIVGGTGTVFGPILGALFLGGLPAIIENYSRSIPFVQTSAGGDGVISVFALNQAIFGALIVFFLIVEPQGLAALCLRIRRRLAAWPLAG